MIQIICKKLLDRPLSKRPGKVNCFVGRSLLQEANTLADDVKITNKPPTHKRFSLQSKLSPLQTFLGERQGSRLSLQPTLISTVPFDFSSIPCTPSIYRLEHTNAGAGTQYTKQLFKLMLTIVSVSFPQNLSENLIDVPIKFPQ